MAKSKATFRVSDKYVLDILLYNINTSSTRVTMDVGNYGHYKRLYLDVTKLADDLGS